MGTVIYPDQVSNSEVLWSQDIQAKDGANHIIVARIRAVVDGTPGVGKVPARFEFHTMNSSGALTLAFTIDSSQMAALSGVFKLAAIETGLTAHAGGTQAAALPLSASKTVHNVTTVGSANDSVVLPASTGGGAIHWVKNSAAANSLQLYGLSADTIDGVTASTGVAVAAGKSRLVVDAAAGVWLSLLGA